MPKDDTDPNKYATPGAQTPKPSSQVPVIPPQPQTSEPNQVHSDKDGDATDKQRGGATTEALVGKGFSSASQQARLEGQHPARRSTLPEPPTQPSSTQTPPSADQSLVPPGLSGTIPPTHLGEGGEEALHQDPERIPLDTASTTWAGTKRLLEGEYEDDGEEGEEEGEEDEEGGSFEDDDENGYAIIQQHQAPRNTRGHTSGHNQARSYKLRRGVGDTIYGVRNTNIHPAETRRTGQPTHHPQGPSERTGNPPGFFPDDDARRQMSLTGGVVGALGNFASGIQARINPTPEQQLRAAKDELKSTKDDLKTARSKLQRRTEELHTSEYQFQRAVNYIHQLESEKQRLRETAQGLENEAAVLRRELADAKNLANIRGKELLGSQVFLTKADTLSISEVAEKVTNLNEEIFQAAALLGESLVFQPHEVSDDQRTVAHGKAGRILGAHLTQMLVQETQKAVPEVNPLLVQVVLQVFLVSQCANLIQSWCPTDMQKGDFLSGIYESIRGTEEQAVSGRWRALTRSRIRPAPDKWHEDLLQPLGSILQTASWMARSENERKAFEQKLSPIFKAVEDLRNALGEKFTSADLDVAIMLNGQQFRPEYMEDAYGDSKGGPFSKNAPPETVIGTTGLGLKKAMKERSPTGTLQFVNVVSAKVALESTLIEALAPAPPKRSLKKTKTEVKADVGKGQSSGKATEPVTSSTSRRTATNPPNPQEGSGGKGQSSGRVTEPVSSSTTRRTGTNLPNPQEGGGVPGTGEAPLISNVQQGQTSEPPQNQTSATSSPQNQPAATKPTTQNTDNKGESHTDSNDNDSTEAALRLAQEQELKLKGGT